MKKVLVTGASGFIGSNLARVLGDAGHDVSCLVRKTSSLSMLDGLAIEPVQGDVTDLQSVRSAVAGKSVVYHLAACVGTSRIDDYYRINTEGTRNVVRACAEQDSPPVLVLVSSVAAVGGSGDDRFGVEDDLPAPVSHYGRSKRAGELAALEYAASVPITVVRPPIVLGEADKKGLRLFKCIAQMGVHFVPGSLSHRFSVIDARDLAAALILAAARGRIGRHSGPGSQADGRGFYFVASDEHPTYAALGRMIAAALGRKRLRVVRIPIPAIWAVACGVEVAMRIRREVRYLNFDKVREIAAGSRAFSTQRAADELGFRPAAPLLDRLRQTVAWYRSAGWL